MIMRLPASLFRDPRLRQVAKAASLLRVAMKPHAPPGAIVVKSVWGLANRIYGLLNAVAYAARFHRPLHVDWTDGMYAEAGVNAFPAIFTVRGVETLETIPRLEQPFPEICRGRLSEECRGIWGTRGGSIFDWFPDFDRWHLLPAGAHDGYVHLARPSYSRPFAIAAGLPFRARTVYARHLAFSGTMQAQLAAQAIPTDATWIGVHYRCTDLRTAWPLERIAALVRRSGLPNLYWATDLAESSDEIRRLLPGIRVETTRAGAGGGEAHRGTHVTLKPGQHAAHVLSACADLHSLAGCGVIVRTRQSTFGRLAAEVLAPGRPRQIVIT
jgi:hypothetical protein